VHAHLARDAAFLGRFRREVAAAQAVNGGYAAPVVPAGPDDHPPWLATAYVAGPSLQEVVTETGPMPEDAVMKLAAGLAEALRDIHDAGLVHRDLKPANVLLAEDGPRVIDFGIARAADGTVLTSAGSVLGTPSFMSPEQAQGQPAGRPATCSRWAACCTSPPRGPARSVPACPRSCCTASCTPSRTWTGCRLGCAAWPRPAWPRTRRGGPPRRSSRSPRWVSRRRETPRMRSGPLRWP
jgi:serine/threonine protein kinase